MTEKNAAKSDNAVKDMDAVNTGETTGFVSDETVTASSERMKPMTAAKKLAIYLPAAPDEFRNTPLTHDQFVELQKNPPEWLTKLRAEGPFPRPEVARKLGITAAALKRNDMDKPLTAAEIKELLETQPEWLREARRSMAAERDAQQVAKEKKAAKAAKAQQTQKAHKTAKTEKTQKGPRR